MSVEQVKAVLEAALGIQPGYWAPGVARLGWSFAVQNDGERLIINRALGEETKLRYMQQLPSVFESAGLDVEVVGNEVLDDR